MLITGLPNQFRAALDLQEKQSPDWQAEQEIFGCSHAEVGAYLLGLWDSLIPLWKPLALGLLPAEGEHIGRHVAAVHVANAIEHNLKPPLDDCYSVDIDADYISRLGLTERLSLWREKAPNTFCEQAAGRRGRKFRLALQRPRLVTTRSNYAAFFRLALTRRVSLLVRLAGFVVCAMLCFNTSTKSMTLVGRFGFPLGAFSSWPPLSTFFSINPSNDVR